MIPQSHLTRAHAGTANLWLSGTGKPLHDGNHRTCVSECSESDIIQINSYLPPRGRYSNSEFSEEVDRLHEICTKFEGKSIILMGDLNIDTSKKADSRTRYLLNFLKNHRFEELYKISEPTFRQHSGKGSSRIDYIFMNHHLRERIHKGEYKVLDESPLNTSSHRPVLLRLWMTGKKKKTATSKISRKQLPRLLWDEGDVTRYWETLQQCLSVKAHGTDPEDAVEYLTKSLHHAAEVAIPTKMSKCKKAPWSPIIAEAVKNSKIAHRNWQRAGQPNRSHPTSVIRTAAKRILRRAQRQQTVKSRQRNIKELMKAKRDDNKLFYSIIGKQRSGKTTNTTELILDNHLYSGDLLPAWDEHFEQLATPSSNLNFTEERQALAHSNVSVIESLERGELMPFDITKQEVIEIIDSLKLNKAKDVNNLVAEHLKMAPCLIADFLTPVINTIFNTGIIPKSLKEGLLHPVHKKGKEKDIPGNYRGITITPILMKVMDILLLKHQQGASPSRLHPLQFGFIEGRSGLNAAFLLTESIAEAKDNREPLYVASLDVQKAFDTLQHQSLLDKLHMMGVAGPWWNLKKDMYNGMLSRVTWEGKTSKNALQVKQGNGQGKTTSPDDYITYLTPLLDLIYQSGAGFHIGSIGIPSPTCADDMLAMATDMGDAQSLISLIAYYANAEHYIIHPEKSVIVPFHVKSKAELEHLTETRPVQINQKGVPIKKEMTHLGITRNNTQPNANIEDRISCARKTLYVLMGSGLHGLNGLPVSVSMHLYRTFVLTRALYGLEATIPTKTAIQELEKFHRRNLRCILGLPERAATAALYILTGSTQMIYMVHIQTLKYLLSLLASGITREVVLRQHATKTDKSAPWVVYVRSLLQKYELPTIMELYNEPPTKLRRKKMVTEAVNAEATKTITEEAQQKSTLRCLNPVVSLAPLMTRWPTLKTPSRSLERTPRSD